MGRLKFSSSGKLLAADDATLDDFGVMQEEPSSNKRMKKVLKKSASLYFLNQGEEKFESIFEKEYWDFNSDGKAVEPLKFSNGKTQEDVVKEVVGLIKEGHKAIFLHGVCGSGKSVIALNIARALGSVSIVVPSKNLQKQYEDDYTGKKYLIKSNGEKMKIAMITGRDNHDSIIEPGISCADPMLPENIKIIDKNISKLREYYNQSYSGGKGTPDVSKLKRRTIALANPYWSPILPAEIDIKLDDARKKKYMGVDNVEFAFHHRKSGCSYYDQYLGYIDSDAIIFNAAKYKVEMAIGRKPMTEVDIIDEADEFLDGLFQQNELNLTRLLSALRSISVNGGPGKDAKSKLIELLDLEEQNKRAIGVDENAIFHINDTKLKDVLKIIKLSKELESEIEMDEMNYANEALAAAKSFEDNFDDVYLTYKKYEGDLYVKLVSTNLSKKIEDLLNKNKVMVFMSGTLHSEDIIKNVFGISDFKLVEAETLNLGSVDIDMTGKEFDCKYSNFNDGKHTREEYLNVLSECIEKAKLPSLIHVNAFKDLPNDDEKDKLNLHNLVVSDSLLQKQREDKLGNNVLDFKEGRIDSLFTTKCSRGMDFPGKMCNSVVFTKYPNPNISDTFWKILQKTHPGYFWNFYKDKARREFLQRMYRAVRSVDDHIYVLSPDRRVLDAVRELQRVKPIAL
tara:strand:- start:6756 stop:8795 length:2040 start_codon:yes stop_codon:yes gene_type:complete